jgi:hypothetical protein
MKNFYLHAKYSEFFFQFSRQLCFRVSQELLRDLLESTENCTKQKSLKFH